MIDAIRLQLLQAGSMWVWILGLGSIALILVGSTLALAWIFGIGRFRTPITSDSEPSENLAYVVSAAVIRIINDFRHLLALIIVLIFAFALAYVLWIAGEPKEAGDKLSQIEQIKEGLQAVVATLGGLVGSIIGYYFGESRGSSAPANAPPPAVVPPATPVSAPAPAPGGGPPAAAGAPNVAPAGGVVESDDDDRTIREAYSPN
ncbi:MAG: hypothetical protein Q8Q73_02600 [Stagnimonas sp.]|nr:hypothetical protein [Stagnimonas sp.]